MLDKLNSGARGAAAGSLEVAVVTQSNLLRACRKIARLTAGRIAVDPSAHLETVHLRFRIADRNREGLRLARCVSHNGGRSQLDTPAAAIERSAHMTPGDRARLIARGPRMTWIRPCCVGMNQHRYYSDCDYDLYQ